MKNNSRNIVSHLIENEFILITGLLPNADYAVYQAIIDCNLNALIELQSHTDITKAVKGMCPPIIFAAQSPDSKILKLLISLKADINVITDDYVTPLSVAITTNQFENAQLLIEAGAEVDKIDKEGESSMMYAIKTGNNSLVGMLISQWYLSINHIPNEKIVSTIEYWIDYADFIKNKDLIELIMEKVDQLDIDGCISMEIAIKIRNKTCVMRVLNRWNSSTSAPASAAQLMTIAESILKSEFEKNHDFSTTFTSIKESLNLDTLIKPTIFEYSDFAF